MTNDSLLELKKRIYTCIKELETPAGFNAAGKEEIFGCIFGRDSFITILKILKSCAVVPDASLLAICKRSLLTHVALQGKRINIESGEQPGKFIHEYRVDKYERLINRPQPWYVYPDNILRNYDSIDATPLALIALYKYITLTHDTDFLQEVMPAVRKGLNWISTYGDIDNDYLIEYEIDSRRKSGGLKVQSWADSIPSLQDAEGKLPIYPIAAVEVQGITWLALNMWAEYFSQDKKTQAFAQQLSDFATNLKRVFNEKFIIRSHGKYYFAQALDGNKQQITTITSHPLICLWASLEKNGKQESIIAARYRDDVIERAFEKDMFVPHAGIRTMSSESFTFNPTEQSYHNGSFWPMLNGLIVEGLTNFRYLDKAQQLTDAMLLPISYFKNPIEVYIEQNGSYLPYKSIYGQQSCMNQAWSAAAIYDILTNLTTASLTI